MNMDIPEDLKNLFYAFRFDLSRLLLSIRVNASVLEKILEGKLDLSEDDMRRYQKYLENIEEGSDKSMKMLDSFAEILSSNPPTDS